MKASFNTSLLDGLRLLEEIVRNAPIGSRKLARDLDEDHARVQRMLKALLIDGYLGQNSDRQYVPGPGLYVLAANSIGGSPLLRASFPVLKELHEKGLHVALGVLKDNSVSYLYHGPPSQSFESGFGARVAYPAHLSSIALILANPDSPPEGMTSQKILACQRKGYAYSSSHSPSISLAVPVWEGGEAIAGLALVNGTQRNGLKLLTKASKTISNNLGNLQPRDDPNHPKEGVATLDSMGEALRSSHLKDVI